MGKDSGGGGGGDPMQSVYTGATRTTSLPQGNMQPLRTLNMNPYFAQALSQRTAPFAQMTGQVPQQGFGQQQQGGASAGQPGGPQWANLINPEQRTAFSDQYRNLLQQQISQSDPRYRQLQTAATSANNAWLAAQRGVRTTPQGPLTQAMANQINAANAPASAANARLQTANDALSRYAEQAMAPRLQQLESLLSGNITPEMMLGGLLGNMPSLSVANNPYGVRG